MLDEILEYQQYSYDLDKPGNHVQRLKRSTLIRFNNQDGSKKTIALTGLNRVLTIIARHFLFDVYVEEENIEKKEKTIMALKSWLGHKKPDDSAAAEVHILYKWLSRYVEEVLCSESLGMLEDFIQKGNLREKDRSDLEAIISQLKNTDVPAEKIRIAEQLKSICNQLKIIPESKSVDSSIVNCEKFNYQLSNRRSFNTSGYADFGEENTVNVITYDRILGNALRAGKLKKYFLACSHPQFGDVRLKSGFKLKDKDWDIVFKLTSCCMMELSKKGTRKVHGTRTITFTESDFINWIINKKCSKAQQEGFLYKGETIFEDPFEKNGTGKKSKNTKWIRLNKHWIEDIGFEILVDDPNKDVIHEYLASHPDGIVFMDQGVGKLMQEIRNY